MRHAISIAVILAVVCAFVSTGPVPGQQPAPVQESPESAYLGLPSGSDGIVSPIDITFSCAQRNLGYYADVNNQCKIFHVCNPVLVADGQVAMMQYSFVCPNNTVFDQQTLTCTPPPGSVPCHEAEKFYYLNQQVEQVGAPGLPQPAVVPVPKHEAPQHQAPLPHFQPPQPQQQLPKPQPKPEPAPLTPVDDAEVEVERPSSYYGKSG